MSATAALAPDAAFALGIASTAMPFASSREDEVEHWLRIMRLSGEAGSALQSLGVGEGPIDGSGERRREAAADRGPPEERAGAHRRDDDGVVALVAGEASRIADSRMSAVLTTTDLLLAVMDVYGAAFDRALEAHGVTREDVTERLHAG